MSNVRESFSPVHSPLVLLPCGRVAPMQQDQFDSWIQDRADRLAWVNDDDANDLASYPGPSWSAPSYEPSPEAAAEDTGYSRGYALDLDAVPPSDLSADLRTAWLTGKLDGMLDRRQDDQDRAAFEADLAESAFAYQDRHPIEIVRAVGVVAARAEGGIQ